MLTDQQLDIIAQSRPASPYDVRRLIADYKRVRAMAAENERLRDIIACMEAEKAGGTGDIETLFAELGVPAALPWVKNEPGGEKPRIEDVVIMQWDSRWYRARWHRLDKAWVKSTGVRVRDEDVAAYLRITTDGISPPAAGEGAG